MENLTCGRKRGTRSALFQYLSCQNCCINETHTNGRNRRFCWVHSNKVLDAADVFDFGLFVFKIWHVANCLSNMESSQYNSFWISYSEKFFNKTNTPCQNFSSNFDKLKFFDKKSDALGNFWLEIQFLICLSDVLFFWITGVVNIENHFWSLRKKDRLFVL